MVTTKNTTKSNTALLKVVIKGMLAFVVIAILGSMLLTTFTVSGSISENSIKFSTMVLLGVGAVAGSVIVGKTGTQKRVIAAGIYILGLLIVLVLLNLVLFRGEFSNLPSKIAAVVVGGAVTLLGKGSGKRKRRRIGKR